MSGSYVRPRSFEFDASPSSGSTASAMSQDINGARTTVFEQDEHTQLADAYEPYTYTMSKLVDANGLLFHIWYWAVVAGDK